MNAVLKIGFLAAVVALFCGCANRTNQPDLRSDAELRRVFKGVMADCRKSDSSPVAAISMFSSHYWLPKSTEQIINKGTDALPVLESISRSSNHAEAELAIACIKLIKSPHVEKGSRQIADKSGITLVSYTVSP